MSGSYPTARARFRDLVAQLLAIGVPEASGRIYRARVWPLQLSDLTALLVYGWEETKTRRSALGTGVTHFDVVGTMAVHGRVVGVPRTPELIEASLETLAGKIEESVMTARDLILGPSGIEGITEVRTTMKIDREGERAVGEVFLAFAMRWTEVVAVRPPAIVCEDPELALLPQPPLS